MRKKLKIALINPGLMKIPPKGWGAIEKVIWNYQIELNKLGHQADILFPWVGLNENEIKEEYDIYHSHIFNQADDLKDIDKDYLFSLHDHHVHIYGKNSDIFKYNLNTIKKSIISLTHAEYLIDYFDDTDKLFFLPHGVDTNKYINKNNYHTQHKLLCVANNGLFDDPSYDRKGFGYSIEAAKRLKLPITIVGPENNRNFFNKHLNLKKYNKLTIIENVSEEELIDIYNDHTIFTHLSNLEAGHPNLTVLESLSCGLPVVGTYLGKDNLKGLIKTKRNLDDVVNKINYTISNYDELKQSALQTAKKYDWSIIVKKLEQIYYNIVDIKENFTNDKMKKKLISIYDNTPINHKDIIETKIEIHISFLDGPCVDIRHIIGNDKKFDIDFIDNKTDQLLYHNRIGINQWSKANRKWFTEWKLKITDIDSLETNEIIMNLQNQKVLIQFGSSSLGDTIAWMPYVEEFRKKHNCIMYCATYHNYLFEKEYTKIKFVKHNHDISDKYAIYKIGWFSPPWGGDRDTNPHDYRTIPLQKTATDILGLNYKEIITKITVPESENLIKDKYVCISEHSTAQAKYWNYPNGWQILVDYLNNHGLKVMVISKEKTNLKNIIDRTGEQPINNRINELKHAEFFIGVGSGLSWLAWAIGKKVVMISGFSAPFCEFKSNNIRIHNPDVCNSCFNKTDYEFDRGDWKWCPVHKNTPKEFICSKSITPDMVIDEIEKSNLFKL